MRHSLLDRSSAGKQIKYDADDSQDEEDMNPGAYGVNAYHSEQP